MSQITIAPESLEFQAPLVKESTDHITITNSSDQAIAFKVKTTAPKLYCVRPTAAFVKAGETQDIEIVFMGLPEEPAPNMKCKDKFLVLALPAPYDTEDKTVADVWPGLEAEFKPEMQSKKIKVVYNYTAPAPVAAVPEPIAPVAVATPAKVTEAPAPIAAPVPVAAAPVAIPEPTPVKQQVKEQVREEVITSDLVNEVKKDVPAAAAPVAAPATEKKSAQAPSAAVPSYDAPLAKAQPADTAASNSNLLLLIAIVIFLLAWLYY